LLKSDLVSALTPAVLNLAHGHSAISSKVLDQIVGHFHLRGKRSGHIELLSPREGEIFRCLVDGLSYKEIADGFSLKVHTVNWHVKSIYQKLGVHSRAEAVAEWRTNAPHHNLRAQQV
jgi:DNA-binding NarL/FixJ family response regulator